MAFLKNMYQKLLGEEIDEESDAETADASDEGVNEEAASNMADEKKGKAPAHSLELKIAKLSAFDGNVMESKTFSGVCKNAKPFEVGSFNAKVKDNGYYTIKYTLDK